MSNPVYFIDFRATYKENVLCKLARLLQTAGLSDVIRPRDLVAVKLHFGEQGNTAGIRPIFLRQIAARIKERGAVPFLTDCNTLYVGGRGDAPHHLVTAIQNGFAYAVAGTPLIIADGLRGSSETPVDVNLNRFQTVYLGADIVAADALVAVTHFKGHALCGFGGSLKNIGMGCASRRGKLAQHSGLAPKIKSRRCVGCGECLLRCAHGAITMVAGKARIDPGSCVGCGQCVLACDHHAAQVRWERSISVFHENMVEYAAGVLQTKRKKVLCVNFIMDVTPACDCEPYNDAAIVRDVGVLAATDPVAVDQAAADLVNAESALPGSRLADDETAARPGGDKFKGLYPKVDWQGQLRYAQQLGLGSRHYELVTL